MSRALLERFSRNWGCFVEAEWEPEEHPRDEHGKFARKARQVHGEAFARARSKGFSREKSLKIADAVVRKLVPEYEPGSEPHEFRGDQPPSQRGRVDPTVRVRRIEPQPRYAEEEEPHLSTFEITDPHTGDLWGYNVYYQGDQVGRILWAGDHWRAEVPTGVTERRFGLRDDAELPGDITPGSHLFSSWRGWYDAEGAEYAKRYYTRAPSRWRTIGFGSEPEDALEHFYDRLGY